jgi:hypothetical protein
MTDKTTPEHHAEAILRKLDRAIERIMGVEIEAMGGDNLAVVLCSHFDCDDDSEPDDCGWSQTAVNAYEEIKEEMAGKFVPVREAILSAVREAMEAERKAVVDWLRDDAIKTADEVRSLHARQKLTPLMSAGWDAMVQTKVGIAGSIERGEHLPTPPRGE